MADLNRGNYRQRSKYLNRLRDEYKFTVRSGGKNTERAKKLHDEIYGLDKELKAIDSSIGTTYNNGSYKN